MEDLQEMLDAMRADGWRVGAHTDLQVNGKFSTLWLFWHTTGFAVRAQGSSDRAAVRKAMIEIASIKVAK